MNRTSAEILALEALSWVAGVDELPDFLQHSGLAIDDLRTRANDPELLASFLDYLLSRDALTKAFCDASGNPPEQVRLARYRLPGGSTAL